jgi:hypothetical protein
MRKVFTRERKIEIEVYNKCKYEKDSEVIEVLSYLGAGAFEVFNRESEPERVAEIEKTGLVDDHGEYLTVYFTDGTDETFRNSYVDMFTV